MDGAKVISFACSKRCNIVAAPNGAARVVGDIGFTDVVGVQFDRGRLIGYTRGGSELEINPNTG